MTRALRLKLILATFAAAALAQTPRVTERTLPASRLLDLAAQRAEVLVAGWDRDLVSVRAEHPDGVEVEIKASADLVEIRQYRDPRTALAGGVRYDIRLPRGTKVRIATIDGPVTIRGLEADVEVITDRGAIVVEDVEGAILADTTTADITLRTVRGMVTLDATAGALRIHDLEGHLTAQTVAGSVRMSSVNAERVSVTSQAGDIHLSGSIPSGGRYDLASLRGNLAVELPANLAATITAGTVYGRLLSEFGTGDAEPAPGRSVTFAVGGGGEATIELVTERGDIRLRRQAEREPPPSSRRPESQPPV